MLPRVTACAINDVGYGIQTTPSSNTRLVSMSTSSDRRMCLKRRWWLIHMMPMKRKLSRKPANPGHCDSRLGQNGALAGGGFNSSTRSVAAMEKIPSEKPSIRPVSFVIAAPVFGSAVLSLALPSCDGRYGVDRALRGEGRNGGGLRMAGA